MKTHRLLAAALLAALMMVSLVSLAGCPKTAQPVDETMVPPETEPTGPAGEAAKIEQVGSTTVLPIADKWREAFNRLHPELSIAVSGGGSGAGIKAMVDGTAQIADSSRPMKDEERSAAQAAGITPVEHIVAYDGIAVIVNPANPLTDIDLKKLSDIFAGEIRRWDDAGAPGLGEIQIISRDSSSGTYEAFREIVVTLDNSDENRDYAPEALKQGSNQAVLELVAKTKGAIGYVGLGYINDAVKELGVVPLEGGSPVEASVENVKSGAYPIARPLYMYTNGEPQGALKDYFDWGLGPEGQKIVADLGFVPIN